MHTKTNTYPNKPPPRLNPSNPCFPHSSIYESVRKTGTAQTYTQEHSSSALSTDPRSDCFRPSAPLGGLLSTPPSPERGTTSLPTSLRYRPRRLHDSKDFSSHLGAGLAKLALCASLPITSLLCHARSILRTSTRMKKLQAVCKQGGGGPQ